MTPALAKILNLSGGASASPALQALSRRARTELDVIGDRIAELERIIGIRAVDLARFPIHLTGLERAILGVLMAREMVARGTLFDILYGARPDGDQPADLKIIDVMMSRLRRKLRAVNVVILTVPARDPQDTLFLLSQQSKHEVRNASRRD